jgi:hypothetical protein
MSTPTAPVDPPSAPYEMPELIADGPIDTSMIQVFVIPESARRPPVVEQGAT